MKENRSVHVHKYIIHIACGERFTVRHRHVLYVLYRRKFSPGENFRQFRHLLSLANFLSANFLSCVNDYIEDMATFTTLAKIIPLNNSAIQRYISGLGEIFV